MLDDRRLVRISKYLSKHLRHQPDRLSLRLAAGGWVAVDELLDACARNQFPISRAELDYRPRTCAAGDGCYNARREGLFRSMTMMSAGCSACRVVV